MFWNRPYKIKNNELKQVVKYSISNDNILLAYEYKIINYYQKLLDENKDKYYPNIINLLNRNKYEEYQKLLFLLSSNESKIINNLFDEILKYREKTRILIDAEYFTNSKNHKDRESDMSKLIIGKNELVHNVLSIYADIPKAIKTSDEFEDYLSAKKHLSQYKFNKKDISYISLINSYLNIGVVT
jgi:hypothetical protein